MDSRFAQIYVESEYVKRSKHSWYWSHHENCLQCHLCILKTVYIPLFQEALFGKTWIHVSWQHLQLLCFSHVSSSSHNNRTTLNIRWRDNFHDALLIFLFTFLFVSLFYCVLNYPLYTYLFLLDLSPTNETCFGYYQILKYHCFISQFLSEISISSHQFSSPMYKNIKLLSSYIPRIISIYRG